jgi:hypothetical protein
VDLQGSSSPSSIPLGTIAIPAARRPIPALKQHPTEANLSFSPAPGRRDKLWTRLDLHQLIAVAEGGFLVIAVYVLIGAGIGLLAGSVMVGVLAGLVAGICAIAAILLIRGSAVAAGTSSDPGYDETGPVGSCR